MQVGENLLIYLGNSLSLQVVFALLDAAVQLERNTKGFGVVAVWLSEDVHKVQVIETAQGKCLCLNLIYILLGVFDIRDVVQYCICTENYFIVALIYIDVSGTGLFHHLEHVGLPRETCKEKVPVKSIVRDLIWCSLNVVVK